ncbi:MAG: hypothetical protein MZU97_11035 [Bacillus subtilis]|nr:hypothetical protein [Bacillus subtilis]
MTIPIVCFIVAMAIAHYEINFLLLFLAYVLGALLHILIGISLSIISQDDVRRSRSPTSATSSSSR